MTAWAGATTVSIGGAYPDSLAILTSSTPPDMKNQFVIDPLISKRQQYLLATQVRSGGSRRLLVVDSRDCVVSQVVRMILRVDDVIDASAFAPEE